MAVLTASALVLTVGCDGAGGPASPLTGGPTATANADAAGSATGPEARLTLEYLVQQAIARVEENPSTARATDDIRARLDELRTAVQAASDAGDSAAYTGAVDSLRTYEVHVVLRVFGAAVSGRVVRAVGGALAEVTDAVGSAGAAGRDVTRLQNALDRAARLLEGARRALGAGDAATALDYGTMAAALIGRVRAALG